MSNYTKTTNFSTKDSLPSGDPNKIVKGAEINTEFDNIATAVATKSNLESPAFTGTVTIPTADINGGAIDGTTIGGATAAPVTSTTLTANTSLNIAGDGATVTGIKDEDDMASNSATKLATQQSIKAYVDSQVTAQDLDVTTDSGTIAIDLDSETLTVTGGTGLSSSATGNAVTLNIDSTVATLTGTQTLTNKTLTTPVISGNLTTDGTIDGRDVAADGSKLDGIESGATADQTAAEIRTLVESATDSNVFTDADHSKLNGIEASADVTDTTNVVAALSAGTGISLSAGGEIANTAPDQTVALTGAGGTTISGTYPNFTVSSTAGGGETLAQTLAIGNTTGGADISFGDNDKATFGAGSDLQIYHDGNNSYIKDTGSGTLRLQGSSSILMQKLDGEIMLIAREDGAVELNHNGLQKVKTTSTGIDVTGTATMDGLVVDGTGSVVATLNTSVNGSQLLFNDATAGTQPWNFGIKNDGTNDFLLYNLGAENVEIYTSGDLRQKVASNGDISFYEDTGTTPKFFWDASAESLMLNASTRIGTEILTVNGTVTTGGGTASAPALAFRADSNTGMFRPASQSLGFSTNGSERMRIDSSGRVGIGTSSPDGILDIEGNFESQKALVLTNTQGTGKVSYLRSHGLNGEALSLYHDGNRMQAWESDGIIKFEGSGSERMRIDSSGNVGIGTASPQRNLQIHGSGNGALKITNSTLGSGNLDGVDLTLNTSGEFYLTNRESGSTIFETGGSERARIDSSGNLLVGKTGASVATAGAELRADGQISSTRSGDTPVFINRLTNDGKLIDFRKDNTTVGSIGTYSADLTIGTTDVGVRFDDNASAYIPWNVSTNGSTDATIDLGVSSVRYKDLYLSNSVRLQYPGNSYYAKVEVDSSTNLILGAGPNGSERARIDSSGNLLVGTTTTGGTDGFTASGFSSNAPVLTLNKSYFGITNGVVFKYSGTTVGTITYSNTATAYNTSSDERLKENIADADDAGSKIDAIQVRQFDWKADGSHQDYGVVAQELIEVAPEAVTEGDTEDDMMAVDYSKLVPTLIKEIQTLRNRVAQLENN
ncbi:tail fiber domain-containing protein [Planctomycetota bacterium]|nr:tail fiber domain-containing protein [Planctomycetota bacterium]